MTLLEAIAARHSVRQYEAKPIEAEKISQIRLLIDKCNREYGLHIQLVTNEPTAFASGLAKYGKFLNVNNYLVMVAPKGKDYDEKIGYCGEQIVLLMQTLGLSSCWVGLTFKNIQTAYTINEGEELKLVIACGYGATEGVQHPQKKTISDVVKDKRVTNNQMVNDQMNKYPDWFIRGVEAALLAPTAVNQQKFEFTLLPDNKVETQAKFSLIGYAQIDLGIAKCHFELAAGKENFTWV